MTKDQVIKDDYAIYNSDCMYILPDLPEESIDLSVYSPPFAGLYNYSSHVNDFSNCETKEQFLDQYKFLISEVSRVTKPGRITAVHCTDVMDSKTGRLWDFPHEIIRMHEEYGMLYRNKITIWKEPLKVRMRTMVRSLMHKLIVEDSTESFTAMPDYLLIFKKEGENKVPVTHTSGFKDYAGANPFLDDHMQTFGTRYLPGLIEINPQKYVDEVAELKKRIYAEFKKDYANHKDPKTNKFSHIVWQRYASSIWDDIRIDNVLPFKEARDEDDEKHVHPLQLDVIDRIVDLYSNPGETVFTPFMGVGSEAYSAVSLDRKAIGIELKDSYFKQAKKNMAQAKNRFTDQTTQLEI